MCVWAALHIEYAVSCMQTAVSILSADLEVFVWTHTYFCLYTVHFSLRSSVQRSFLRIRQGKCTWNLWTSPVFQSLSP